MKILLSCVLAAIICLATSAGAAAQISSDGYFNGIRLWGRVRVVNSFPDLKT